MPLPILFIFSYSSKQFAVLKNSSRSTSEMKKFVWLARKNRLGGRDLLVLVLYLYGTLVQFNLFLFFHNAVFSQY